MRNGFGLGDRLFWLVTIFLNFKRALNLLWVIPVRSGKGRFAQVGSFTPSAKQHAKGFLGSMCLQLFPPLVIYAAAVGRLEQNNLPWLTDGEERNGRNHYFPVKISLKQRGAELCMLRGVFGPLINSRGPISPSKAFLIISPC